MKPLKISELIEVLKSLKEENGDLDTCVGDSQYAERPITKSEVKIQNQTLKIGIFPNK